MWKSNFIYRFLFLIIFCNNTHQQSGLPPIACPDYFKYLNDGSHFVGLLTLPDVGNDLDLTVHFSQRTRVDSNYIGELIRLEPLKYRVEFPSFNDVPKLTKITVNGEDICSTYGHSTGTKFYLSTQVRTVNRPQISFQPQTSYQPQTFLRPPTFNPLFQNTEPVTDHDSTFMSFIRSLPNIYPSPQQEIPEPLRQFIRSFNNTVQVTERQPTFKSGSNTVERFRQPAPQVGQCGVETAVGGFVFGGEEISRGQFPWLAAIYNKQSGIRFLCGGSLVSPRTVVSAGHCFRLNNLKADRLVVELGRHNLEDFTEKDYETREIEKLIIHPEYNPNMFPDADLAILHLVSSVQYTRYIRPICLSNESSDNNPLDGQNGTIAGWGADENGRSTTAIPKKISINIVNNAECRQSSNSFSTLTSERTFCAGSRDGTGPCIGDSGSGFMIYRNDRWYIRGVVSGGQMKQHTCDLEKFVVFSDIAKHYQWIQSQVVS